MVNISMCKSCSNMVNLSEKSLPKPTPQEYISIYLLPPDTLGHCVVNGVVNGLCGGKVLVTWRHFTNVPKSS